MTIKDNNVEVKIRTRCRSVIYFKNVKFSSKFNNNLISYYSQRIYETISETVENQMEGK